MLANLFDKHYLIRRVVLLWGMALVTWATGVTVEWALGSVRPSLEIAAITAAIFTPVFGFISAIFKFYVDSRTSPPTNP
jgi:hypothetical protein